MNRKLKKGGAMALFTVIVIAAVIVINLMAGKLPAKYRRLDLSTNQIFSLSDTTTQVLDELNQDVNLYLVGDPEYIDSRITEFAQLYAGYSGRVHVEIKDPVLHPDVLATLDTEANTVLVSCDSTGRKQAIPFSDIIQIDPMAYYQYQQIHETAFDGEGQITSAIASVTNEQQTKVYQLSGHKETALASSVTGALNKSGMTTEDLNLLTQGSVPADCGLLLINSPQTDLAKDETAMIQDYLDQGGHVLVLAGYTPSGCPNLTELMSRYGMNLAGGYVADPAPQHYYNNNPFYIFPEYDHSSGLSSKLLTGIGSNDPALLLNPSALTVSEELEEGLSVTPFLTTSGQAVLVDPETQDQVQGEYVLGAVAAKEVSAGTAAAGQAADGGGTAADGTVADGTAADAVPAAGGKAPVSTLTLITAPALVDGDLLAQLPSITNLQIFMNAATYGQPDIRNISIPPKSLDVTFNVTTAGGLWSALLIIVIPVLFLIAGFVIWMKRRKL